MEKETIDFILESMDWAERSYEEKAAKHLNTVEGYLIIYKDTKSKFERARRELRMLRKQ